MLLKETAVFALVMVLMGVLLSAGVLAVGLIVSLIAGGKGSPKFLRSK